jgi:hypothetical protein
VDEYEAHNADMHVAFWSGNFKGRHSCGDLDVKGRKILKCILKKVDMRMCRPAEFNTGTFSSKYIYVIFHCKIHMERNICIYIYIYIYIFKHFLKKSHPHNEQYFLLNYSY